MHYVADTLRRASLAQLRELYGYVMQKLQTSDLKHLKAICKGLRVPRSGSSSILIQRIAYRLQAIINEPNYFALTKVLTMVSCREPKKGHSGASAVTLISGGLMPRLLPSAIHYSHSPFLDRLALVLGERGMPCTNDTICTVKDTFILSQDQIDYLQHESQRYRLMVFCRDAETADSIFDVAFPIDSKLVMNGSSFVFVRKDLPLDVTAAAQSGNREVITLSIEYSDVLYAKVFSVWLVCRTSASTLLDDILVRHNDGKEAQHCAGVMQPRDFTEASKTLQYGDKVQGRADVLIRSVKCNHARGFSAIDFLRAQGSTPDWRCPICARCISFKDLRVKQDPSKIHDTVSPVRDPPAQRQSMPQTSQCAVENITGREIRTGHEAEAELLVNHLSSVAEDIQSSLEVNESRDGQRQATSSFIPAAAISACMRSAAAGCGASPATALLSSRLDFSSSLNEFGDFCVRV